MPNNIITEAEKAGVDAIAGLTNFFGNHVAQLKAAKTFKGAGVTTTATGDPVPAEAVNAGGGAVDKAIGALETVIADAAKGQWKNEPKDILDLLVTGMAALSKYGVSVPGLSVLAAIAPVLEAIV